jgi:hypothetical protein
MTQLLYDSLMPDILVEWDHSHISDAKMAEILLAFEEIGVSAEQTEQTTLLKAAGWVLVLHWVGDDLPHLGFDSLLTLLARRVWKHYRKSGGSPPARIDLYDADDDTVASIELKDEDTDGAE